MGQITAVALALEELARSEERERCMKAMCLYCANGDPVKRQQSPITKKWFWVHGGPTNRCDAGPIRDMIIDG